MAGEVERALNYLKEKGRDAVLLYSNFLCLILLPCTLLSSAFLIEAVTKKYHG